ncbi:MAG TPA: glycosyltransferase family 4 protein [Methanomassiliicoccales archaeon]|nr:glycosyltransferase family 4 protein [Methanomassiliicoccales archaeon]
MSPRSSTKVVFVPKVRTSGVTSERSPKMMEMLSSVYDVTPVQPSRINDFVFDQRRNQMARYLLFPADVGANLLRTLRAIGRSRALVFAEGSYFSFAAGMAARLKRVPMVWDNHGHIVKFAQVQGKSAFFTKGNVLFERILVGLSSKVLVVNERDRQDYVSLGFEPGKLEVVPTCADMDLVGQRMRPREEAKRQLGIALDHKAVLFVGTLNYEPNLDAVAYLASILPRLRAQVPEAKVYIAGSGPVPFAPPEGMEFLGFVPDLHLWLSAADLCVAPMWKGLGILTKVIDYMSAERATVVTPLALDGIPELAHGENCLLGKDKEAFLLEAVRALEDDGLRERIATQGRELIARRYSCAVVMRSLTGLVDSLVERGTILA